MKYKLVIFDFDGTLGDTLPWFTSVFNAVAERYRFKTVTEEEIEQLRGTDARSIMKYLGIPQWKVPLIATHVRSLLAQHLHQVSLYEGVDAVLHGLAASGARLALVSSNSEDNARRILGPANAALISYYECGVSIFGKPAKIRKVLRSSGVSQREAILIGDEVRDGEAARKAQVAFGAVTWGYNNLASLSAAGPAHIFTRVAEIAETIL